MGNETGPAVRGDGLDRAIRCLPLLLLDTKSAGLLPYTDAVRDLCTRAPEGARWLSTQIVSELARVDATPTDRVSGDLLPTTLKRARASDRSYHPSKRIHKTEEPSQMLTSVARGDDKPVELITSEETLHPGLAVLPGRKTSIVEMASSSRGLKMATVCHDGNDNAPSLEQDSQSRERQIKRLRNENITLVYRLHEALQNVDELQHCARAADPTQTLTLSHENLFLRKQLLALGTAHEDFRLIRTGNLGPSREDISAELEAIEHSIACACASLRWFSRVLDEPKDVQIANSVLSQLASTSSGLDFKSLVSRCKEYRIEMVDVLRSLVAAALWALVWQHPPEETVAAGSPILRHYKKQVSAMYGPRALHEVELLAYKSLVSEPCFDSHFIASQSESLSDYMCHILGPLLDSKPKEVDGNVLGMSDSAPSALFVDVMMRTIELAAKLYLADRGCFWKFFQPGSSFDPQTMKPVEWTGTSHQARPASNADVKTVQLCIFPAFYMNKTLGSRANPDKNERMAFSAADDLSDYQPVAKGLVLLQ